MDELLLVELGSSLPPPNGGFSWREALVTVACVLFVLFLTSTGC